MDAGITYRENGPVDAEQLNALYRLIGWDRDGRRTPVETARMLEMSHYYVAAYAEARLVGFARVCGDPYVVQLLDVITHPQHRRRGIATRCLQRVAAHVDGARYVSVTCTAAPELHEFYARFGFLPAAEATLKRR